jgi:hypothetical protein
MSAKCVFEDEAISVDNDYRWVKAAWEKITRNGAGGTHAIRLADRTAERYACRWCIDKRAVAHVQHTDVPKDCRCMFCDGAITIATDYREVSGWERLWRGGAGGTNGLRLRVTLGRYACHECIDKQADGVAAEQQALAI